MEEATLDGGAPFTADAIIRAQCTARTAPRSSFGGARPARVLLLDAGGLLVSEHVQNIAESASMSWSDVLPADDPGPPRGSCGFRERER